MLVKVKKFKYEGKVMLFIFMEITRRSSKNRNSSKSLPLRSGTGVGRIHFTFWFIHSIHVFLPP